MPRVGERCWEPGMPLDMEWLGDTWTSVCPDDDVALTVRIDGYLCCPTCRRTHVELSEQAQRQ